MGTLNRYKNLKDIRNWDVRPTPAKWSDLLGRTVREVKGAEGHEELALVFEDGSALLFRHIQDCCESVYLEDIAGDLDDLIGNPLLMAEEVDSDEPENYFDYQPESYTWTFYKFATIKGSVTLRWLGESNGYYSEEVDVYLIDEGL